MDQEESPEDGVDGSWQDQCRPLTLLPAHVLKHREDGEECQKRKEKNIIQASNKKEKFQLYDTCG